MATAKLPQNLIGAIRYFADIDICTEFVASLRWPNGWACHECGGVEFSYLTSRRLWKCKACKKQTSVKVGTIFEDSALGLDKWLPSVWLIANSKNGISSHELGRALGVTQKSAWFMLHRIRLAMQTGSFDKFDGIVEVDETFIGGKARNMHKSDRARKITGTGGKDKTIVAGVLNRGDDGEVSKVRAGVVSERTAPVLQSEVRESVAKGATVYTDALGAYTGLGGDFEHETVDHAECYVRGQVHTNGIENFWSLLKRGLHGTYISVEPFHLFRYLDERVFTYNERNLTDLGRFTAVLGMVGGRRLTWQQLTGGA
ncbi:MAG: IS1595 family transposase [Actinomycetota bacterium]|nr:IS1595 family transposase [Actinomycetota bacterium]